MLLSKVVSGGQTGVDRAALDVAAALSIQCGGWCPAGRRAEDGSIDARYPLRETPSGQYIQRTEWNVRDSQGTLSIADGPLSGGTLFTKICVARLHKPYWISETMASPDIDGFRRWLKSYRIETLNVAGPRESDQPGIYERAAALLRCLLGECV